MVVEGPEQYLWCTESFTGVQYALLDWINVASSYFGILGSCFIISHYLLWSRGYVFSQIIFFLSIADLGASGTTFISQVWLLIASQYSGFTCTIIRSILQFFFVSSMIWTSCIAFYLSKTIIIDRNLFLSEKPSTSSYFSSSFYSSSSTSRFSLPRTPSQIIPPSSL
eukprot:TRINITY_DN1628_c0_g1_i12.p1 TRINITY_DN1628_c0_g1~~TRINITY_DN1628_c0_g1_i12.p1  ORF type:complete len:167 (+),score=16.22 TRINITY_DN1628_c0_g1_i12:135-635(+)